MRVLLRAFIVAGVLFIATQLVSFGMASPLSGVFWWGVKGWAILMGALSLSTLATWAILGFPLSVPKGDQ